MSLSKEVLGEVIDYSEEVLGEFIEFNAIPLNSAILYIAEGLVPLLSALCKQLRSHSRAGLSNTKFFSELTPKILTTVGCNLSVRYIVFQLIFCFIL